MYKDTCELKSLRTIKSLIKNGKINAKVIYQANKKIVISLKSLKNINLLKVKNKVAINTPTFYNLLSEYREQEIEFDHSSSVKGVANEYILFFDFTNEECHVEHEFFERDLSLKELPYISKDLRYTLGNDPKKVINSLIKFKKEIEEKYPNFFNSDYFKLDNSKIVNEINNAEFNYDKLKRNKKLQYLMNFSRDTKPIYDTLDYLSSRFDLNNSNDLWIVLMRKYWDNQIKFREPTIKSEYFREVDKYFLDHPKYVDYFIKLKTQQFKNKLEVF